MKETTIKVPSDSIDVLKSAISLEKSILKLRLDKYRKNLKKFEKEFGFTTEKFLKDFESGKLGDDSHWFDWLFAYKSYQSLEERMKNLESIQL